MALLLTGPAQEPVSLPDAKTYLRISHDAEDAQVQAMIVAARRRVEAETGRALLHQVWRLQLDGWPPGGLLRPPLEPVAAILGARVFPAAGAAEELDPDFLSLATGRTPMLIAVDRGAAPAPGRRFGGIEVDLRLGYGADPADVPPDLVGAVLMATAALYEQREGEGSMLPPAALALIAPYRRVRL